MSHLMIQSVLILLTLTLINVHGKPFLSVEKGEKCFIIESIFLRLICINF